MSAAPRSNITTAANVNDVTQTLALVDGIPPVAGRPGRPRRRPDALLGDKGYDSNPHRDELRRVADESRPVPPVISRKGSPNIGGVEQVEGLFDDVAELADELHDAFVSLACSLICYRRLKKTRP
ncbi:putative transposase (IS4 family) [Streptomyces sp. Tu6071]|nr:putative transposase (IS4 family) [Streptomyces sp. Tu6071]